MARGLSWHPVGTVTLPTLPEERQRCSQYVRCHFLKGLRKVQPSFQREQP